MTPLSLANDIAASDAKLAAASECEKEATDDSKFDAQLVDVADTLKRAISERMRVTRLPSHRRRHNWRFVE